MNFTEAKTAMRKGKYVKCPEWSGYWFMPGWAEGDETIKVRLATGELVNSPFIDKYGAREDWMIVEGLGFDAAIKALKKGKYVTRKGWNGNGMFLFLLEGSEVPKDVIHDPALREVIDKEVEGDTFTALPTIRMWTRDSSGRKAILTGWLASQTDMLSEDWEILN